KPFFRSVLGDFSNNIYDYQFNTIHDYCRLSGTDGCIIGYGTIGFHLNRDDSCGFARRYSNRPLVIVTEKVDLPNCHNIISDNHQGMFDVIEHLIVVHGCKKILFMRGPRRNTDAIERFQGYLDAMEKYKLPVDDSMIGEGDFSAYVDKEVERVLDANPDADAFAFSNDEMASACYRVCEKRGLRIGADLKITGFDGGEFSQKLIPPLTSVIQDACAMGRKAVEDMARILRGEQLSEERFPVHLVARESCGCALNRSRKVFRPQETYDELKRIRYEAAKREEELLEYQGKSWFIPMMARDLNDCVQDETEYCFQVMEKLKLLKVKTAYLFLLDHSVSYDGESEWTCPDNLYLASCYRHGESFAFQPYDRPHVTEENGIAQLTDDGDNHQFMCFLLFSGDRQYGLLVCDVTIDELAFFYVVSLQLGLSLQYLEISKVQEMHRRQMTKDMEAIRARNRELDMLSGYDQLSGLLNLRGLTESVKELCRDGLEQYAYLLYCDLDHLKQINDYFGHPEGNYAITVCASVLRSCIRETDKLARVGGDEFVCLVLSDGPSFPELFRKRLNEALEKINESSGKPFYVGISVGIQPFVLKTYEDFHQAVAQADKKLYEAKKKRRPDVRREM
ncbi:MAG: diguanylate cyclase domain-containing protein, partial [Faecousia sp.]